MTHTFRIAPASAGSRRAAIGLGVFFIATAAYFPFVRLTTAALGPMIGGLLMFSVASSMRNVQFYLTPEALKIQGDLFGKTIRRDALVTGQARIISLAADTKYQPFVRTFGTGWPGYLSGWFRLRNREKCLLFITGRSQTVYLPTTLGYSLLLSVDHPEEFVQALQEGTA